MLAELRRLGHRADIALLTGDRAAAANAVAAELRITEVHAELLPEQKAEQWREPSLAVGGPLIPPLPTARCHCLRRRRHQRRPGPRPRHVGLAIGGRHRRRRRGRRRRPAWATRSRPLPLLVRLSRETVRIIRQNILWFAFGVNLVGIVADRRGCGRCSPPSPDWYETGPARRGALPPDRLAGGAAELDAAALVRAAAAGPASPKLVPDCNASTIGSPGQLISTSWLHALAHRWKSVAAVSRVWPDLPMA